MPSSATSVFADAGNRPLRLESIAPPASQTARPFSCCMAAPGRAGAGTCSCRTRPRWPAQGFVAVASEYRLTGEAKFPAQIHDVKRALRWVRAQAAELGIDPAKLCLERPFRRRSSGPARRRQRRTIRASIRRKARAASRPPSRPWRRSIRRFSSISATSVPPAAFPAAALPRRGYLAHDGGASPVRSAMSGPACRRSCCCTATPTGSCRWARRSPYAARVREAGGRVDLHLFAGFSARFRPIIRTSCRRSCR